MKLITTEKLIALNQYALERFPDKKSDCHEVKSYTALREITEELEIHVSDTYEMAFVLITELTRRHAFASGNRRTAILAMVFLLKSQNEKVYIANDPLNSRVLLGIRERYYQDEEIRTWIKTGEIRPFQRGK